MDNEKLGTAPFDRKEAARRLGVSVVTLDRLIAKRRIPHAGIVRHHARDG